MTLVVISFIAVVVLTNVGMLSPCHVIEGPEVWTPSSFHLFLHVSLSPPSPPPPPPPPPSLSSSFNELMGTDGAQLALYLSSDPLNR